MKFASLFPKARAAKSPLKKRATTVKKAEAPVVKPTTTVSSLGFGSLASNVIKDYVSEASKPLAERNITPHTPSVQAFPMCCGARIMTGFPSSHSAYNEIALDKGMKNALSSPRTGQIFAILAEYQSKFEPVLLKHGFEKVKDFGNPVHGGSLCTSYVLTQTKSPSAVRA